MINTLSLLNGKPPRLGRSVSEASVLEEKDSCTWNPPTWAGGWALSNSRVPQAKEPYLLGRKTSEDTVTTPELAYSLPNPSRKWRSTCYWPNVSTCVRKQGFSILGNTLFSQPGLTISNSSIQNQTIFSLSLYPTLVILQLF